VVIEYFCLGISLTEGIYPTFSDCGLFEMSRKCEMTIARKIYKNFRIRLIPEFW
jgi:hypothetical protein